MRTKRSITDWLSKFEISVSSASTSVFNNSRQQVKVNILAIANEGITLSTRERASLRIVKQVSFGRYELLVEEPNELPGKKPNELLQKKHKTEPWFFTVEQDTRFDYFPALTLPTLPEPPTPPELDEMELIREGKASVRKSDDKTESKDLYIHSRASGGSKVTLRVTITRDAADGGEGEVYYSDDLFDSSIDLYAHATPYYVFPQDYVWVQTRTEGDSTGGSRFIHEHLLRPIEVDFSYVKFEKDDIEGMIRWQAHQPGQTFASHVGIAWPRDKTVHYNTGIRLGANFPGRQVKEVNTDNPSAVIVLLQGDNQIPYYPEGTAQQGPCRVSAYDRHGTLHRLLIKFDDSQPDPLGRRTKLTVVNTSIRDEQTTPRRVANISFFQVKGMGSANDNTSCPLFNNTYQSTNIDIVIQARDDRQQIIKLTDSELNSIQLVSYDTGAVLGNGYTTYIADERRPPYDRFDKYPGTVTENSFEPDPDKQGITFWLTTNTTKNLQIAARLVLDGVTYHTHQNGLPVGGVTVAGKSNSSATIVPHVQPRELGAAEFSYKRTDKKSADIDLYNLWITDAREYRIRYSLSADVTYYMDYLAGGTWYAQAYFKCDRARNAIVHVNGTNYQVYVNGSPYNAYAARVMVSGSSGAKEYDVSYRMTYLDQYGNRHRLWIRAARGSKGNFVEWVGAQFVH
ncbi:hypothetical protein [Pseudomonas sichuanensis]|uniref:Uncharacterized protein n=1 Tax=Pseudomonas sichuanensis TaxID=2213015 RepID=A0ABV0DBQ3_9PSED